MSDGVAISIPHEYVNDESVTLLRWVVAEGQHVREGETLAELETSKALVELAAVAAGRVLHSVKAGQEVLVGSVIGYISSNGSAPALVAGAPAHSEKFASPGPAPAAELPSDTRFSKKALELLAARELSPILFAGRGMIREQDVLEYAKNSQEAKSPSATHFALEGISLEGVTLPPGFTETSQGKPDPQFLQQVRADLPAFAKLSSAEKCRLYRQHGAVIGDGVVLGEGTVLLAPQIVLGEGVHFGENTSVHCRERFCVGPFASFRRNLHVQGGTVVIGRNIWGGKDIQIGGGGHADPWSLLCIGDDVYLGDDLYINICRPILIGKGVFLTQRSILMTHNVGHSPLEGYENRFAPVVLGDYSQIGMYTTVYAGCYVGRAAIVTSNSYVISSIPPGKLAMGVPARVVRDAARVPDRVKQLRIVHTMIRDYHELLRLKGRQVSALETSPHQQFYVQHDDQRFRFLFMETLQPASPATEPVDETVIWTFDAASPIVTPEIAVMDLLAKQVSGPAGIFSNSSREFLRKRGIRCEPGPWRYSQGLI